MRGERVVWMMREVMLMWGCEFPLWAAAVSGRLEAAQALCRQSWCSQLPASRYSLDGGRREACSPSLCWTPGHNQRTSLGQDGLLWRSELIYLNHSPRKQGDSGERCPIVWIGPLRL